MAGVTLASSLPTAVTRNAESTSLENIVFSFGAALKGLPGLRLLSWRQRLVWENILARESSAALQDEQSKCHGTNIVYEAWV